MRLSEEIEALDQFDAKMLLHALVVRAESDEIALFEPTRNRRARHVLAAVRDAMREEKAIDHAKALG